MERYIKRVVICADPPEHLVLVRGYLHKDKRLPGGKITIEPLFKWDGASIPRAFWVTTGSPWSPNLVRASPVHDYLYTHHLVPRKVADDILDTIMAEDGVRGYNRTKIYLAVRAFGWVNWAKRGAKQ